MIRTWTVAPPEPRRHIVHIAKLDMDLFASQVIPAHATVCAMRVIGNMVEVDPPNSRSTVSLSASTPYLVTFSDGTVARTSYAVILQALEVFGQTWTEGS